MAFTLTGSGVVFPDSSTSTTSKTTGDKGTLIGVSNYSYYATNYTWTNKIPDVVSAAQSWTATGTTVSGSNPYSITPTSVTNSWTTGAYTAATATIIQAKPSQTSSYIMLGLTTNPAASVSYANIEYALYFVADSTIQIYESGTYIGTFGYYNTNHIGRVTYDGSYIRYYCNEDGTRCIRAVAVSGKTLKAQVAFYNGGTLNTLYVGSLSTTTATKALIKVVGGGGGSAGYLESGGAGGYSERLLDVTNVDLVTVTVGGGGNGVTYYAASGDGGTSSFGAYASATGGYGANRNYSHTGGYGGVGSGGDINLTGGGGTGHGNHHGSGGVGKGGQSYWGDGQKRRHSSADVLGHSAPGSGAPGSITDSGTVGTTGAVGSVVVYSYK